MATYHGEFTIDGRPFAVTVTAGDMQAALRKLRREHPGATGLQVWLEPKP